MIPITTACDQQKEPRFPGHRHVPPITDTSVWERDDRNGEVEYEKSDSRALLIRRGARRYARIGSTEI